jgi:predicted transcriptional regulator of viral defense system
METNRISLQQFRKTFLPMVCFSGEQVRLWKPDFCRDNFARWIASGNILRLKRNLYTFPEYLQNPDSALYFANQIYRPSYISLHTALHFHGIIPEEVVQFTSVSTLKTGFFQNAFGSYTYHHISANYMFGYELKKTEGQLPLVIQMSTPEKAIIDLLHLYPEYSTVEDMLNLRLNEDYMENGIDRGRMLDYEKRIDSPALTKRLNLLREAYGLI